MGLPHKLKNFNVFGDGDNWIGKIPEVALPKIALKVEQYRGGGMLAEIDVPLGLEKMEMEIKLGGLILSALRSIGATTVDGSMLRFVGAYQEDVAGAILAAELVVRGLVVELDPGNAKVGDNTEWSRKMTISYLKWLANGRTEIEIDVINCVFMVDGVDKMAGIRAALQQ